MAQAQRSRDYFRPDIQGLRAIAVVSVMIFHFFPGWVLPGGFTGVDIFFVISGFVISSSVLREVAEKKFSLWHFYGRRVRRLYPALILVIAASAAAGWRYIFPTQLIEFGREIAGAAIFAANIYFYHASNYFEAQNDTLPLLHLWSLGVEEQFYIIFPLLCLVGAAPKQTGRLFYATAILSLAADLLVVRNFSSFDFYMPMTRFWEFFAGIFIAFHEPWVAVNWRRTRHFNRLAELASLTGILLIAFSVLRIRAGDPYPGYWAIFPCLGAALLIFAGGGTLINQWLLSNRIAVFIGTISYPLYLWHWPIRVFVQIVTLNDHIGLRVILLMVSASLILATLTYYLVELPLRAAAHHRRRRIVTASYIVGLGALGCFGLSAIVARGYPVRFTPEMLALDHNYGIDAGLDYHTGVCFLSLDQSPSAYGPACENINNVSTPRLRVLIWGDSHAADLISGFSGDFTGRSISFAQYTSSLCAPILNREARGRPFCRQANAAVLQKLEAQKPDVVMLSALWPTDAQSYLALTRTIAAIRSSGIAKVIVIGPAPLWNQPVIALLEQRLRNNPNAALSNYLPRRDLQSSQIDEPGLRAATEAAGGHYVSLLSSLCNAQGCLVKTGPDWRDIVTFDTAHFTGHGSRYVAKLIGDQVFGDEVSTGG